jgi:LemA protein
MDGSSLILGAMLAAIVLAAVAFVRIFNRLVGTRNACRNARSSIEVNLKKRHDLVPNLVRVVRGYAEHEREVLQAVTEARRQAVASLGTASSPCDEAALTRALHSLDARVEAYPDLQASEQFLHLSKALTELEEQISAARRAFNAHVMAMNNLVERFPTLTVARLTGFAAMDFFEAGSDAREAPAAASLTAGGDG